MGDSKIVNGKAFDLLNDKHFLVYQEPPDGYLALAHTGTMRLLWRTFPGGGRLKAPDALLHLAPCWAAVLHCSAILHSLCLHLSKHKPRSLCIFHSKFDSHVTEKRSLSPQTYAGLAWISVCDLCENLKVCLPPEWRMPTEHDEENHSEGPNVHLTTKSTSRCTQMHSNDLKWTTMS